jgi:DNA-binding NtrC family response regulator
MTQAVCDVIPFGNGDVDAAAELTRCVGRVDGFAARVCAPEGSGRHPLAIWVLAAGEARAAAVVIAAACARASSAASSAAGRPTVHLVAAASDDLPALGALETAGAHDFIALPARTAELALRLQRALRWQAAEGREPAAVRAAIDARLGHAIGRAPAFVAALEQVPAMAASDAGVLILGETGTGKEVFAQALHALSRRAARPLVAVNCSALPVELFESELFGHVKGAFTTAHAAREGLVREADGGTLFLDDVDGLPPAAQAKLLRFLQDREYRPVGANALRHADVRVVAASNRDLARLAARGEFRPDLFYRLSVLTLGLPPLRQRREDHALLAQHFLARSAAPAAGLTAAALQRLAAHDWPGNVRELQHVIDRACVRVRDRPINAADLVFDGQAATAEAGADGAATFREAKRALVSSFERGMIEQLLSAHGGNVTRAAAAARKNRRAFVALMRKYAIESSDYRHGGARELR